MKKFCLTCAAAVAFIAGMPVAQPTANAAPMALLRSEDATKAFAEGTVATFLNQLAELKLELKAANTARAKWAAFSEDFKKWTPEEAEKNKDSYTHAEYMWSVKKDKAFRALHTDTPAAKALREFQEKSGGAVAELFATDAKGGNVAQSQNTSDWFQGDEAKFQKVDGKKELFFDKPKRDDTIGLTVVQVSFPIFDGDTFIGMVCASIVTDKIK